MTETFYVCGYCGPGKTIEELRSLRPIVTHDGDAYQWDCPGCGRTIFVALSQGTLDLGLVRESTPPNDDFEILG